ncbi:MAG: hypothetical protein OK439_01585 [Thaumarchaeota archaeon]|nr:hypothetical protein [Nitrososphaerota archaeon]
MTNKVKKTDRSKTEARQGSSSDINLKRRQQAEAKSLDRDAETVEADEEEGKEEFGRENP